MTNNDLTPGKDTATRKDKADKWAQTPNLIFALFLIIPILAAGVFADQDTGRSGADLMADLVGLHVWLMVTIIGLCTLIGLCGAIAITRSWLARKDELERRIDMETGFWAGTAAMFSVIGLAIFEAILPGHLTPWIIAVIADFIYIGVTFFVRRRLRNNVA